MTVNITPLEVTVNVAWTSITRYHGNLAIPTLARLTLVKVRHEGRGDLLKLRLICWIRACLNFHYLFER